VREKRDEGGGGGGGGALDCVNSDEFKGFAKPSKRQFMAIRSLQMQQSVNMQQLLSNYSLWPTPLSSDNNASQLSDLPDYTLDGTVEDGLWLNYSDSCPASFQNMTYLNVSCDAALNFSEPLLGETPNHGPTTRTRSELNEFSIFRHHRTVLHPHYAHRQLSNRCCAIEEEHADADEHSFIR
jgi:hypothetical protein